MKRLNVSNKLYYKAGFTLVEISIVLVIIGLLVGGVLVGRDLIRASQLRGLVSELDEFKAAANTFRLKYGQLPGDMRVSLSAQLGFFTFTNVPAGAAIGNNDGIIQSKFEWTCLQEGAGFFRHLAEANLIKSRSDTVLEPNYLSGLAGAPLGESGNTPITLSKYLPESKIGGAFFCAGNLGYTMLSDFTNIKLNLARNIFGLIGPAQALHFSLAEPAISPLDLYSIDKKIDDGMPVQGKVLNSTLSIFTASYVFWGAAASSGVCTFGGANASDPSQVYNANSSTGGNSVTCQPVFIW